MGSEMCIRDRARIAQARSYTADPVTLLLAAEQRLNDLMEEA